MIWEIVLESKGPISNLFGNTYEVLVENTTNLILFLHYFAIFINTTSEPPFNPFSTLMVGQKSFDFGPPTQR